MGQLLLLNTLVEKADWYFPDAWYNYDRRAYTFKWPSDNYSHSVYVHHDHLENNLNKIAIREFVESSSENVIYDVLDKSYRYYYSEDRSYGESSQRSNYWYRFNFRDKETALVFKLKFSNISTINLPPTHPRYPTDIQEKS